jgi:threonine-phosphate decarboxylase
MSRRHGGNIWPLLEKGISPAEILDFSVDLNPLGPPPGWEQVLREGLQEAALYPDPSYRDLRQAIAAVEGISPDRILPGNGTADLIHLITRWLKPSQAAVAVPTFTEYERAVRADGGEVVPCLLREEDGFLPGPAPETRAQLLFLCNPNNPTGRLWPRDRLLEWLEHCRRQGITAVVDEAYMDFVEDGLRFSAVQWLDRFPRLIVLRSMTKSFAVPGLRLGYLTASERIVSELSGIQPPWPVNGPAALAGRWLAGQQSYLEESRRSVRIFRQGLQEQLQGLPALSCIPSEANFILCRITDLAWDAGRLAAALAERGILVRTCGDFTGLEKERFIRVAVRRPEQNERLLRGLKEILGHAG